MKRFLLLVPALILAAGTAQAQQSDACKERIRALDERRAKLRESQDATSKLSADLQARTAALDAERAAIDNRDRREVGLYNVRAKEHEDRVAAHNERVEKVNAEVEALNKDLLAARAECAPGKK